MCVCQCVYIHVCVYIYIFFQGAKCYKTIKNFDKNHLYHLKVLWKKAKARSVMPAHNSPACPICILTCESVAVAEVVWSLWLVWNVIWDSSITDESCLVLICQNQQDRLLYIYIYIHWHWHTHTHIYRERDTQ